MAPSIEVEHILTYFRLSNWSGPVVLSLVETEDVEGTLPWSYQQLPGNDRTALAVLYYVVNFLPYWEDGKLLIDIIKCLDDLASEYDDLEWEMEFERLEKEQQIDEMYVNSYIPEVLKFFKVPKLQHLSEQDKSLLKENQVLAGFMEFLIRLLDSEALDSSDGDTLDSSDGDDQSRYGLLPKELTFLLTFLGDIPFQFTELQQVKNILAEFEIVANEAGAFIYSCVFASRPVNSTNFYKSRDTLLEKVGLLNEKIKEHCVKFSELPRRLTPRKQVLDDSLFAVDSLLENLENMINCRIDMPINHIKGQIETIHEEMASTRTCLGDIKVVQDTFVDELKESFTQISDVAYEAEYLVNSYFVGNVPIWYINLRLPTVIQVIKLIGVKLHETKKICDMKVSKLKKDFDRKLTFQAKETPGGVDMDNNILVGFEDEKSKILDDLTSGPKSRQIISIFGLPGLGKTTMAKKLHNDPLICDHFDERAWCVVSQTYQKRNVLIGILMSFSKGKSEKPDKEKINEMDDESLGLKIYQFLKGHRYLIVLDDVWQLNVWDDLKRYFPGDGNGSRVIITSRVINTAPIDSVFHPLHLLTEDQCWDLLQKKVFVDESCPTQLLGVGKAISAKCHGLPLAVVVIAGTLAKLAKEKLEWEKVERNLDSYIFYDPLGCSKILELSYDYLPDHLKRCFLYFGAFPEDTRIPIRKLIWFWVAEGFILKQEQKSPEIVAEEYLSDLINRSLVILSSRKFDGRTRACSIHDLLHEMCLRKAYEENFLKTVQEESSIYEKHQRLCVHSEQKYFRCFGLHCRSFLGRLSNPTPDFSHMPLLRVLDILPSKDKFDTLVEVYLLFNLRYLSTQELPDPVINNLVNLEVLCLDAFTKFKLSVILKMVKLRHLRNTHYLEFEQDCDTSETTNLVSLGYVYITDHDDEEILRLSPYLRKLKCTSEGTLFPEFSFLTELQSLKLGFGRPFNGEIPENPFPSSIKRLTLANLNLHWEDMSVLGKLLNLCYLSLSCNNFQGKKWVTKDGEFQELGFLKLSYGYVKQWITCSEHFPKLQCLKLHRFRELEEMPSDLGNISTLQKIKVSDSSYKASISTVQIEKEQHDYGNEELKVFIDNFSWTKEKLLQDCDETS